LLNNAWTENQYRYDICWATYGALIEHLWNIGHKYLII
jgi:hypothetical protein